MNMTLTGPLVSTDWLANNFDNPAIRIIDSSWYLPAMQRNGAAEYGHSHIPGAVFWDIEAVADKSNPLPHMAPTADEFAAHMERLGIGSDTTVVVYDGMGLFTAARPWWMLRAFGHEAVAVLDGGLPKWMSEGRPVTDKAPTDTTVKFTPAPRPEMFRSVGDVMACLDDGSAQILDARSAGRFAGSEPEPRPECRAGHIPGSKNLPFNHLVDPQTKLFVTAGCLKKRYTNAGIDLDRPVITSCGSGVTACVLALGLALMGKEDVAVYDGSWSEWGTHKDTPVETI
jgi:thiosulfate/3-mercaptopyruvate sulfurtransferase